MVLPQRMTQRRLEQTLGVPGHFHVQTFFWIFMLFWINSTVEILVFFEQPLRFCQYQNRRYAGLPLPTTCGSAAGEGAEFERIFKKRMQPAVVQFQCIVRICILDLCVVSWSHGISRIATMNFVARGAGCSRLDGCGFNLRRTHERSAAGPAFHDISSHFARQCRKIWVLWQCCIISFTHVHHCSSKFMHVVSKSCHHQASWHHTEMFLPVQHVAYLTWWNLGHKDSWTLDAIHDDSQLFERSSKWKALQVLLSHGGGMPSTHLVVSKESGWEVVKIRWNLVTSVYKSGRLVLQLRWASTSSQLDLPPTKTESFVPVPGAKDPGAWLEQRSTFGVPGLPCLLVAVKA